MSLEELLFLAGMSLCALLPFAVTTWAGQRGKHGLALTICSILGAALTVLIFATSNDFGLDPVRAMGIALIFFLPATLGALAGWLLGWMVRRRRERDG